MTSAHSLGSLLAISASACLACSTGEQERQRPGDIKAPPPPELKGDAPPVDTAPGGYYVQGNTIYTQDGTPQLFHGVARPSLEWSQVGEHLSPGDYERMASWGSNIVRIALNQAFWRNSTYRRTVDQNVGWAIYYGMAVILDLHWSEGNGEPGQKAMADEGSLEFWAEVADAYKNDGRVLFELYNEPHSVPWEVWRNGGAFEGFEVAGMQELYDVVRARGAHNLVIVGGLDWAYNLKDAPLLDGYNIAYASHPYDWPHKNRDNWYEDWAYLAVDHPVIVTEFGAINNECDTQYGRDLLDYAEARNISWTAWAWYVGGCSFPSLLVDWGGTPSAIGQVVRQRLEDYADQDHALKSVDWDALSAPERALDAGASADADAGMADAGDAGR